MAEFAKIMNQLTNPTHNPGRSGKDLSHRKVLTLKLGELVPILCEEVLPRDYFELDLASLVRSCQPLQTSAFMRAKVHYDVFFVPSTAVWSNFENYIYQKPQQRSSILKGSAYEPNMTLEELYACCESSSSLVDSKDARFKIASLLGCPNFRDYNANPYSQGQQLAAIGSKSLSILPFAGYNLIYNMIYRNAWRDEPDDYDRKSYNLDWLDCSSYAASLAYSNDFMTDVDNHSLIKMHYHGWYSDLFMGSLPNAQFGSVSSIDTQQVNKALVYGLKTGINGSDFDHIHQAADTDPYPAEIIGVTANNVTSQFAVTTVRSQFDVIALRKAIAMQKYKEQSARSGWKDKKQSKAFYGVETPNDRKHDVIQLNSFEFPIMIDEVVSQNGANGGNLGDLGGKAIGVDNTQKIVFNSEERHGYLYVIAYIMPESEYDAVGIDPMLVRSVPFDRYNEAFENLGLTPVSKYHLNAGGNPAVFGDTIGFAPRYWEYKTRNDKVYGEFIGSNGTLRHWVTPRIDLESIANSGFIPTSMYYVYPSVGNNVFGLVADGSQTTDQFMLNVRFTDKAVRPMSDIGLPSL